MELYFQSSSEDGDIKDYSPMQTITIAYSTVFVGAMGDKVVMLEKWNRL